MLSVLNSTSQAAINFAFTKMETKIEKLFVPRRWAPQSIAGPQHGASWMRRSAHEETLHNHKGIQLNNEEYSHYSLLSWAIRGEAWDMDTQESAERDKYFDSKLFPLVSSRQHLIILIDVVISRLRQGKTFLSFIVTLQSATNLWNHQYAKISTHQTGERDDLMDDGVTSSDVSEVSEHDWLWRLW